MKTIRILKIFLASPSDVNTERTMVIETIDELNETFGSPRNLRLELIHWEKNSFPDIGNDPQEIVFNQLEDDYEVFICIFWKRIGTKTPRADSGTIEELDAALEKYENGEDLSIMCYFKTEPPINLNEIGEDYFKVMNLKKKLGEKQLYRDYPSTEEFQTLFRKNLTNLLTKKIGKAKTNKSNLPELPPKPIEVGNEKRNAIIAKLQKLSLTDIIDTEFLNISESLQNTTDQMIIKLNKITGVMNVTTTKVSTKADELKKLNIITDNKLRFKKRKVLINQLANEIDVLSDEYDSYIPEFLEYYDETVENLLSIYTKYGKYLNENDLQAKNELLESIDNCMDSLADLLTEMDNVPTLTSKYGKANLRQMKLLKLMTEKMLYGRIKLDEIE